MKKAIASTPFRGAGYTLYFLASPDLMQIGEYYRQMQFGNIGMYFSDDASVSFSLMVAGVRRVVWYNIDISGCDASTSKSVVEACGEMFPEISQRGFCALKRQLSAPIQLGKGADKLLFEPIECFEYSGSLLTTLLNNTSILCVLQQLYDSVLSRTYSSVEDLDIYVGKILGDTGWKLDRELCEKFEDLQFLKTSPCYSVSGEVVAILNLGVVLRAIGQTYGDLPGSGDIAKRSLLFLEEWTLGLVHIGEHDLHKVLRDKYLGFGAMIGLRKARFNSDAIRRIENSSRLQLDIRSVCARYRMSICEFQQLITLISQSGLGDGIACLAADLILLKDYGLRVPCGI